MALSWKDLPDKVELKVEDRPDRASENAFNTDTQQEAAHLIEEHWPIPYTELAEIGDSTDALYRQVLKNYFGPEGDDITFKEIDENYSPLDAYYLDTKQDHDKQTAFERGYNKGFEQGFKQGKRKLTD